MIRSIGYARVSTDHQNADLQRQALKEAACDRIIEDTGLSGSKRDRPGLLRVLRRLKAEETLVFWKLDRLGRSLPHLIELITSLRNRNIAFVSFREQIDTSSAGGRFYLHILAALADFEREMISERTQRPECKLPAVVLSAWVAPCKLSADQVAEAHLMLADGVTRIAVAKALKVSPLTLRKAFADHPETGLTKTHKPFRDTDGAANP